MANSRASKNLAYSLMRNTKRPDIGRMVVKEKVREIKARNKKIK